MTNDIISDLLTRIRNATNARHTLVKVPSTKMTDRIVEILKEEGYIYEFWKDDSRTSLIILLKYIGNHKKSVITTLKRISKPGKRVYLNSKNIMNNLEKFELGILSTSQGVMTTSNAQKMKIGGEFLCKIS